MARKGVYSRQAPRRSQSSNVLMILILLSTLVFLGIVFSVMMAPRPEATGPSTNSLLSEPPKFLSQKIMEWSKGNSRHTATEEIDLVPDWKQEFWSPIDVDLSYISDPEVTLCKLNFKKHSESPHLYPMFRDLETVSNCRGNNRKKEKVAVMLRELKAQASTPGGRFIAPTAFVFHESRVGSTLVANSLASNPFSMVYSESAPAANALLHCSSCTLEQNVEVFQNVLTLMGRTPIHKKLFFKFQSITSTKMHIALQAFPDTPWVFVYRMPVQTMMSHLDPRKGSGSGAPCLRSMRDPPAEVRKSITDAGATSGNVPREAWCAAHLNMLCSSAVRAHKLFGRYNDTGTQRGFLVNYDSLPGSIARLLLPSFGIEPSEYWLTRMAVESKQYSKSRGAVPLPFTGDSEDKEERATAGIQKFAKLILDPTYDVMEKISSDSLKELSPALFTRMSVRRESGMEVSWQMLKDVPITPSHDVPLAVPRISSSSTGNTPGLAGLGLASANSIDSKENLVDGTDIGNGDSSSLLRNKHSSYTKEKEKVFIPWAPFSNTHNSRPYEVVDCPPTPSPNYPITYNMYSQILENWNTDNTEIPPMHYDSLCHFDFQNKTEQDKALAYRKAERPFVVYNIPEVDDVVRKWNNIDYLHRKLGKKKYRTETSKTNHFMYWHGGASNFRLPNGKRWEPPTGIEQETFEEWLEIAVKGQNKSIDAQTHEYFRVSSDLHNEWLFDELPFFKPRPSLMIVDPREQRGIHCRFGMRNVIAEAHFDGSRNAVVMLGGLRRWVLTHPDQCVNMHMLPKEHPSGRHSDVDWSKPDVQKYPNFVKVQGNEVILQPGDFLYVPTYWIHYIVSLNVNFQCNTRSGRTANFDTDIQDCGF